MSNAHVRARLGIENWGSWGRPKWSDLGSRMPWRDEVENSESRGERRCLDGTVVRTLLSELDIQQGNEDRRDDQHNDEGYSKANRGGGHDGLSVGRVLAMGGGRVVILGGIVFAPKPGCCRDYF